MIMNALAKTMRGLSTAALLASAAFACSGAEGLSEDEFGAGESDNLAEEDFALNSDDDCGEADPNKIYDSIISPTFTSPSNYASGRNGCGMAYFVRVNDYRDGNTSKYNYFDYAGPQPSTAAACENLALRVYVFERKSNGSVEFIGNKSASGVPYLLFDGEDMNYAHCTLPSVRIENQCTNRTNNFNLQTGKDYVFAVSARSNNSGPPTMQPIKMGNGARNYCPSPG
jgi:hypothetical protein